ncbi:MAG: hypothetical protein UU40_C0017G0009 [Candidatus Uhrbacteria bacterium GW2011_GWD2_41_121]|nr:MAG: hypothetical protein UT52_C0017G0015 [Candidatus Uhrbacteria bacterium GW2011_GWE1_39_46]KKR63481.1 MAG: hypothetical protein UU04_C0017G0009 [Candidatus Uhrbacteria bacterium GW2011_GWC2_40_450]KKR89695.1 MAG: hypothetical protein UU40_C0017G0009 [Candidatus Uhrbacteria bacterium GW2011_GWD2_41_121]KKS10186.1 MAG: hypothetical protein UU63_C0037G0011 [Candidatus Uhrbacteria bacterium GW2011_GWF2_41_430]KKS50610.1 MAG: hypothetical protein UV15_C0017G0009 [Candidatus Uhrbacteria bacteri
MGQWTSSGSCHFVTMVEQLLRLVGAWGLGEDVVDHPRLDASIEASSLGFLDIISAIDAGLRGQAQHEHLEPAAETIGQRPEDATAAQGDELVDRVVGDLTLDPAGKAVLDHADFHGGSEVEVERGTVHFLSSALFKRG